jgi:hypothetical protein
MYNFFLLFFALHEPALWKGAGARLLYPLMPTQKHFSLNILPISSLSLSLMSKLQFMQQYIHNALPRAFFWEWLTNKERRNDPEQAVLRNQDNLYVPFARTTFVKTMP